MLILVLRSAEIRPVDTLNAVRVVNGKPSVSIESLLGTKFILDASDEAIQKVKRC